MSVSYIQREGHPDIAYVYSDGVEPLVVFCGGYRSDMAGKKATYLEAQCKARGQAYLRFDYGGHGESGGKFEEGTIGSWRDDMLAVFEHINPDRAILVGSSMGGWMALMLMHSYPEKVKGFIGIAPAPDFTEDMFQRLSAEHKEALARDGFVKVPNEYSDEPYHYSMMFYDESKQHYLLDEKRIAPCPMRILQGLDDIVVLPEHAERIKAQYEGDVSITLVEGGDHSLSRPKDLELIDAEVRALSDV